MIYFYLKIDFFLLKKCGLKQHVLIVDIAF